MTRRQRWLPKEGGIVKVCKNADIGTCMGMQIWKRRTAFGSIKIVGLLRPYGLSIEILNK